MDSNQMELARVVRGNQGIVFSFGIISLKCYGIVAD